MNKFKAVMTKKSNSELIDRELHYVNTNQKQVKPITDNFIGQIFKIHYITFKKLKMFKSIDWYAPNVRFIKTQQIGTYFFFVGDDVKKLADDAYPMIMKIRSDELSIKLQISSEYALATWVASTTKQKINKGVSNNMELEVIQIISKDRCFLYYKSKYHGNERLKAQYYFRTRTVSFDIED